MSRPERSAAVVEVVSATVVDGEADPLVVVDVDGDGDGDVVATGDVVPGPAVVDAVVGVVQAETTRANSTNTVRRRTMTNQVIGGAALDLTLRFLNTD